MQQSHNATLPALDQGGTPGDDARSNVRRVHSSRQNFAEVSVTNARDFDHTQNLRQLFLKT